MKSILFIISIIFLSKFGYVREDFVKIFCDSVLVESKAFLQTINTSKTGIQRIGFVYINKFIPQKREARFVISSTPEYPSLKATHYLKVDSVIVLVKFSDPKLFDCLKGCKIRVINSEILSDIQKQTRHNPQVSITSVDRAVVCTFNDITYLKNYFLDLSQAGWENSPYRLSE